MGAYQGGRMNITTTNTITNTTTNMELGREQPNLQLAERVVGEVHDVHCRDIAEQVLVVT
jgi:hypothetical protein